MKDHLLVPYQIACTLDIIKSMSGLPFTKKKGAAGLENKRNCKKNQYSFEEKCKIVREYQDSELTLPEICSRYGVHPVHSWDG